MHSLLADSIIAIAYFMVFPESNARYLPPPPPRVKYHFHSAEIFFTNFLLYLFVLYIIRFQNSEIFITLTFLFVIQCFYFTPRIRDTFTFVALPRFIINVAHVHGDIPSSICIPLVIILNVGIRESTWISFFPYIV